MTSSPSSSAKLSSRTRNAGLFASAFAVFFPLIARRSFAYFGSRCPVPSRRDTGAFFAFAFGFAFTPAGVARRVAFGFAFGFGFGFAFAFGFAFVFGFRFTPAGVARGGGFGVGFLVFVFFFLAAMGREAYVSPHPSKRFKSR